MLQIAFGHFVARLSYTGTCAAATSAHCVGRFVAPRTAGSLDHQKLDQVMDEISAIRDAKVEETLYLHHRPPRGFQDNDKTCLCINTYMIYYIILYYIIFYFIILYYITLYYITLHYIILYIIFFYIILYYIILY